jgi:uncharacterized protein (AIM24 family)
MKRAVAGGSLFMTEYTAVGGPGLLTFAAKLPGQVLPVEVTPSSGYMVHRHGFMCGTPGVQFSIGFQQKLGAGVFGGTGFRMQRLTGQGQAWVELNGEVVVYDLQPGNTLRVHPGHVGMYQDGVQFNITTVPGIKNALFGGDGIFPAALIGQAVWLQSMSINASRPRHCQQLPRTESSGGWSSATCWRNESGMEAKSPNRDACARVEHAPNDKVFAESDSWRGCRWRSDAHLNVSRRPARWLLRGARRAVAGGTLFHDGRHGGRRPGSPRLAAKLPGQILPMEVTPNQGYLVHRHGFMCATPWGQFNGFQRLGAGVFGGTGFTQRLRAGAGAGRARREVVVYDLQLGNTLRVHPGHVGMYRSRCSSTSPLFRVSRTPCSVATDILAALTGPGRVWLQSMSMSYLASIQEYLPGR